MDTQAYEPYHVGQRVYFYNEALSKEKFYGTVDEVTQRGFGCSVLYGYYIKFDGLGRHHYTNGYDFVCIYPVEAELTPTWEV